MIGDIMERLIAQGPYLVEDTPIAPDITGSGVFAIVQCLRSCPLDWDLASMGFVDLLVLKCS